MLKEDYVSFETALLLKAKGFNERCGIPHVDDEQRLVCYIPTYQTAMRWLRKEHNIHVEVRITNHSLSMSYDVPRYYWILLDAEKVKWMDESTAHESKSFKTYEEACEEGIKYCLQKMI